MQNSGKKYGSSYPLFSSSPILTHRVDEMQLVRRLCKAIMQITTRRYEYQVKLLPLDNNTIY